MSVSREAVVWAFRLVLGREPESEEGIRAHMGIADENRLVETLLRSAEFRASGRFSATVDVRTADAAAAAVPPHQSRASFRAVIFGNCQAAMAGRLMQAMTGDAEVTTYETTPGFLQRLVAGEFPLEGVVKGADLVFVQMAGEVIRAVRERVPKMAGKLRLVPPLAYGGFHPDCVYVTRQGAAPLQGAMGEYQSSLAYWAWRQGLDAGQAAGLFCAEVYEALGFHDHHAPALTTLLSWGQRCDLPLGELVDGWRRRGSFMHTVNHPKRFALADVVAATLRREGIAPIAATAETVDDHLARWPVWPVYPELGAPLGIAGGYDFKLDAGECPPGKPVLSLDLPEFIEASYKAFDKARGEVLGCARVDTEPYAELARFVPRRPSRMQRLARLVEQGSRALRPAPEEPPTGSASPYAELPDARFWRRSVERILPGEVDPVLRTSFAITRDTRVATAGSCFAQNIARHLQRSGFHYFVADADESLAPAEAERRQFGIYSARYGNLYTARQLVQLFDRAHGWFRPADVAWRREDGRFVDPMRPRIEPDGFPTAAAVQAAATAHLAQVKRMFADLDVFVFTLGLTESWRRRSDGAVFPLAPGVAGGRFDPAIYEFVNFDVDDVLDDLLGFERRLRSVNPAARMIVTVSPVPLIATYEDQHVLVATAESKARLRAAAGRFAACTRGVDYFPSFEIVTGTSARGAYFADDLRSIREEGIDHVMRVFFRHYADGAAAAAPVHRAVDASLQHEMEHVASVVCDEEAIDRHR
jgi:hypothetical protein